MKILNFKQSVFTLALGLSGLAVNAQVNKQCGSTEAHKVLLEKHPEMKISIDNMDEYLNSIDVNSLEKNRAGLYVIPIVFHILHNYGAEYISDAQIKDQIRILNVDYQKKNADTSSIVPVFWPIIANVGFEFRLATIDPNGNCTDGIDRINTYKTYFGNDESKINPWPRNRYFNVWVANTIKKTGVAAYAYKPATAHNMPFYDGVIALHDYIGSIGTGDAGRDGTLTHEIGHCMNLDHLWGSTNEPEKACGDDNVSDTPPTEGHLQCSTVDLNRGLFSDSLCKGTNDNDGVVGKLENLQNFMEYSYCPNEMFTNGQKDRMITALTSNIAQRSELFTATTHALTGTLDGQVADCDPIADFNAVRRFSCLGNSTIVLKDFSHRNTINSREWTINNGTPATSTALSPSITYSTTGWQSISLKASTSATKSSTITKSNYIYVSDPADKNVTNEPNTFEDPNDYSRWPIFNYFNNQYKWKYYDGGNTPTGWRALMFDGFDTRTYPENLTLTPNQDIDDIITPCYNTSGLTNGFVSFKVAAASTAGTISQIDNSLIISYTSNCGSTWTDAQTISGSALINNGSVLTPFYPSSNTAWSTISVPIVAAMAKPEVYFRIRHRAGEFSNNLFIDNFMVGKFPTAVINNDNSKFAFALAPNPATETSEVILNTTNAEKVTIVVTDLVGKVIYNQEVVTNANQTSSYQLPRQLFNTKGIYMVTVGDATSKKSQKLVIQ